jgi:hypothetical protein
MLTDARYNKKLLLHNPMLSTLSACYERYSRDSAGPKLLAMQELHRWLAQRLVLLHRERYEAVAMWLHSRV